MESALYLLQASGCVIVFYALYVAALRNSTFFRANRIYLLVALLFSFCIPLLDLDLPVVRDYHLPATDFLTISSGAELNIPSDYLTRASAHSSLNFISTIYWSGFTVVIIRFLFSVLGLIRLKNGAGVRFEGGVRIVRTDGAQPFSFFNLIFLPKGNVDPLIVEHEKAHVHFYHWADLFLIELARAILWFNPVLIFYQNSIKIQHEYEADNYVMRNGAQISHYLDCILQHLQSENAISSISQFYSQNIKKRIVMMTRKKTPRSRSMFYLLLIPLTCLLLFAFSKPSIRDLTFSENPDSTGDDNVVIIVDAGHGGEDSGTRSRQGLSEKEFALTMAKTIQKAGETKNIKVILTRSGDDGMNLEERVSVSNRHGADIFISIHANYDAASAGTSGIECVVSEKSIRFQDSQRLAKSFVSQFQTLDGISTNGIKKSDAYILREAKIPAILVELGYFSNENDYAFLMDKKNQQLISERIVDAVVQYTK